MGSLIGHIVPGAFFALFAIWWAHDYFQKYFRCRLGGKKYTSNPRFGDPREEEEKRQIEAFYCKDSAASPVVT
jgi:hypothetical protein